MSAKISASEGALGIVQVNANHLRIMAGPGTGKTFAIKQHVMRLLEEGSEPSRILVVTFTRTAAESLVSELKALGVPGCNQIRAGTLHSFCFSLLRKEQVFGHLARSPRPLVVVSKSGYMQFEASPMMQDLDNKEIFGDKRSRTHRVRAFEAAWARLQEDTPGWAIDPVDKLFQSALLSWLQFHTSMLIGELVPVTLRYLRENPTCPELVEFDHIIVDEYQDLNRAEQVLINLLASNGTNLMVVGDEDQSIYSFRHAHPQGIIEFGTDHPQTQDKSLVECRRCPRRVVELANNLILNNHLNVEIARLNPMDENQEGEVYSIQWEKIEDEAIGLGKYIEYLIAKKGYSPSDILVISPRRVFGYGIRDWLVNRGIEAHSFFHEEALEEKEAQNAFALLTLLVDKADRVALRYMLGYGRDDWREKEYSVLRKYCEQSGIAPWDALDGIRAGTTKLDTVNGLLKEFEKLNAEIQSLDGLKGTFLLEKLFPSPQPWAESIRDACVTKISDDMEPSGVLDVLRSFITQPETPESGDFVRIMSPHKSKGLTSKVVIVTGCVQGLIPKYNKEKTPSEQEAEVRESRRLFYVAVTRTKEVLVLSSVRSIVRKLAYTIGAQLAKGSGKLGTTIASEFLTELGPNKPDTMVGTKWLKEIMG